MAYYDLILSRSSLLFFIFLLYVFIYVFFFIYIYIHIHIVTTPPPLCTFCYTPSPPYIYTYIHTYISICMYINNGRWIIYSTFYGSLPSASPSLVFPFSNSLPFFPSICVVLLLLLLLLLASPHLASNRYKSYINRPSHNIISESVVEQSW